MKRIIYSKSEAPVSFKVVFVRFLFILALIFSVAYNVMLWLKYERLQEMVILRELGDIKKARLTKEGLEIIGQEKYKSKAIDARGINLEYQNLNEEVKADLHRKRDRVEKAIENALENAKDVSGLDSSDTTLADHTREPAPESSKQATPTDTPKAKR